jgi:predicted transposase/invertase (TIGR01784 family)
MRPLELKPTNDIVFKMMFTRGPDAHEALAGLLTAVLRPRSPIASLVVENPDIPRETLGEKQVYLDIKVRLEDGSHCDVEMQTTREAALPERMTVYGAKVYGGQLTPGASYASVHPVVVIVFLAYEDSRFPRFHASYRMREDVSRQVLTHTLVTHVVSLPRLQSAGDALRPKEAKLLRWARLLFAQTREEAANAAGDDPAMRKAAATLDQRQDDPHARELAKAHEFARQWRQVEQAAQRAEGRAEGVEVGRAEGVEVGLRRAVLEICEALGVVVPTEGARALATMNAASLERLLVAIKTARAWPR